MADDTQTAATDTTKYPWESKTIVLNFIAGLLLAASAMIPQAAVLNAWLSAHVALVGTIWAILGIGIRAVTSGKIVLGD